jgi:hypothetical protein
VLLYLYLQRLARIADRPALAGRIRRMMWVAVAMAIAVLPSLMSWFSVAPTVPKASLSLYGFAAFIVCFRAMDLMLELRQALRALDPDAARRRPN